MSEREGGIFCESRVSASLDRGVVFSSSFPGLAALENLANSFSVIDQDARENK